MNAFVKLSTATLATLFLTVGCVPQAGSQTEAPADQLDTAEAPEERSLPVAFFLSDEESDTPRTSFQPDDDIVFHYAVTNATEHTLPCEKSDGGPGVRFSLFRDGRPIAEATEGLAFMQMVMIVPIEPGDMVFTSRRLTWEGFREEPALQPGSYTARAQPVVRCPAVEFPPRTLEFSVVDE